MGSGNIEVRKGDNIKIKETVPTDSAKNNGSFSYTYDGSNNLIRIDQVIGAITYRRTLTYDINGNISSVSSWVQV